MRTFPFTVQFLTEQSTPLSLHQVFPLVGLSGLQDLEGHYRSFPVSGYWALLFREWPLLEAFLQGFTTFQSFLYSIAWEGEMLADEMWGLEWRGLGLWLLVREWGQLGEVMTGSSQGHCMSVSRYCPPLYSCLFSTISALLRQVHPLWPGCPNHQLRSSVPSLSSWVRACAEEVSSLVPLPCYAGARSMSASALCWVACLWRGWKWSNVPRNCLVLL